MSGAMQTSRHERSRIRDTTGRLQTRAYAGLVAIFWRRLSTVSQGGVSRDGSQVKQS